MKPAIINSFTYESFYLKIMDEFNNEKVISEQTKLYGRDRDEKYFYIKK